jgi:tRNA(adenine34) deaminase
MQAFTAASDFLGGKYLKECTLYVTLEPCQMCAGASYWAQLGKIVFGAKDEHRGFKHYKTQLHPKTKVIGGILEDECGELLTRFFIQKRNLN